MPGLSEEELRLLEQMERALVEEDPKFASTLRGTSFQKAARRRAILAGVVFVLGMAALTAGVIVEDTIIGIVGFIVMLASAVVGVTAIRHPAALQPMRETRHGGLGVVDGGRASRPGRRPRRQRSSGSFMERMEHRWQRRRERGPF